MTELCYGFHVNDAHDGVQIGTTRWHLDIHSNYKPTTPFNDVYLGITHYI